MSGYNDATVLRVDPGRSREPYTFSKIRAAIDYVRGLRRVGVEQPIRVLLPEETLLDETIRIDGDVRGVVFAPAGERARIVGGVRIEGFAPDEYNGVACLSAALPPQCLDGEGRCAFTDLYVNGTRASLTRWPAEGYFHSDEPETASDGIFDGSEWFIAAPGDFRDFRNMERIQLSFCHFWGDEHTPIAGYDPETRRVRMKYRSRFNLMGENRKGLDYWLENVGEAFRNPGEWYADAGRVYYVPRDETETAETLRVFAPTLHELVRAEGAPDRPAADVCFRDIDFSVTRGEYGSRGTGNLPIGREDVTYATDAQAVSNAGGAVVLRHARCVSLEGCRLENFGLHGLVVGPGCHGVRAEGCLFRDGGAGGVKIEGGPAGSPESEHTYGNTVEDCRILYCGRRYYAACGVLLIHTYENTVAHNEIGHLYYTGVSVGWVWGYGENISRDNRILKNHIHDLGGGMLSDMGGVYLLGKQPGTVVSGNVIHDVRSRVYGGWALYTDEGSSCMTLENNVCYNTSDNSYHQHYGSMNVVRNNIFAFSDGAMLRVSRTEPHLSILFEGNIVCSAGSPIYDLSRRQIGEKTVVGRNNLLFDASRPEPVLCAPQGEAMSLADFRAAGQELGSAVADPRFADPAHFDFTLAKDSPALALGFRPIDVSDVGPRR